MVKRRPDLDAVFSALADPTRRRIVERLVRGELTVGEIAAEFPISQPAISKHVKILEQSGLLTREIDGRVHRCRVSLAAMRDAAHWLEEQERFWNGALDNLDDFLARTSPDKEQR
ncbi:MAG TPA: metalloregulator ArsR/SmtB family transcription factor [Candidatus Limnocylindria bacterium]|jgi:DNA-binding transcriptional ArsR family regulator|nr:metalloregulator ArsR/SmtB family transcription factor [Candidatus Limnocylindria bacterium]